MYACVRIHYHLSLPLVLRNSGLVLRIQSNAIMPGASISACKKQTTSPCILNTIPRVVVEAPKPFVPNRIKVQKLQYIQRKSTTSNR